MSIHTNLEEIKAVAIYKAKEHNCNYNIIIHNAVDGEFKEGESTYEFVRDSYFETDRQNCVLLHKTDDLINKKGIIVLGHSGVGRSCGVHHLNKMEGVVVIDDLTKKEIDFDKAFGVASEGYLQYAKLMADDIHNFNKFKYSHLNKKEREANIVDVRREPKIARNQPCPCGSNKKYKNCCLKNK